jgi:hypothetical protein
MLLLKPESHTNLNDKSEGQETVSLQSGPFLRQQTGEDIHKEWNMLDILTV